MAEPTFRQRRLGEALKVLRERAGLSQREAAERFDYNVSKLSRIENGQVPDIHATRRASTTDTTARSPSWSSRMPETPRSSTSGTPVDHFRSKILTA